MQIWLLYDKILHFYKTFFFNKCVVYGGGEMGNTLHLCGYRSHKAQTNTPRDDLLSQSYYYNKQLNNNHLNHRPDEQ